MWSLFLGAFFCANLQSQNLIRNGGFEDIDLSYALPGRLLNADASEFMAPWFGKIVNIWHRDHFINGNGCWHEPENGQGYVSVWSTADVGRERAYYLGQQLSRPLEAGTTYYFELFYSTLGRGELEDFYIQAAFGAYLSQEPQDIGIATQLDVVPQVRNNVAPPYECGRWNKLAACFEAEGGEEYITIGFFDFAPFPGIGTWFHIDNISLIALNPLENILGEDRRYCQEDLIASTLDATLPIEAEYEWQDGSRGSNFAISDTGTYWVEIRNECFTITDTLKVMRNVFEVDLGADTLICDSAFQYRLISPSSSTFYMWNDTLFHPFFDATEYGTYWLMASQEGCADSDTIELIAPAPTTLDLGPDTLICRSDLPYLLNVSPNRFTSISWQDGQTGFQYAVEKAGTYIVEVEDGCGIYSDTVQVELDECHCRPYIPTAFTPNQDEVNDLFQGFLYCRQIAAKPISFSIFDRWGNEIYLASSPTQAWDGMIQGQAASEGVYIWLLRWEEKVSEGVFKSFSRTGSVTLIR